MANENRAQTFDIPASILNQSIGDIQRYSINTISYLSHVKMLHGFLANLVAAGWTITPPPARKR